MTLNKTEIPTADFTWNLITGCLRGCPYCYAGKLARGRLREMYLKNNNTIDPKTDFRADPKDPFCPRLWWERRGDPRLVPKHFKSKNPNLPLGTAMIFTVDMGDLFGPWIPWEWKKKIFERIKLYPDQIFQILTKFPENMMFYQWTWFPHGFPQNVWAGVTLTKADKHTFPILRKIKASIKYVSAEPLQGPLKMDLSGIDWVIIGPQTNPTIQPENEWVREIIESAARVDCKIFLKPALKWDQIIREWPAEVNL